MNDITELLIRKSALKDVELWLNEQYIEIEEAIGEIKRLDESTQ